MNSVINCLVLLQKNIWGGSGRCTDETRLILNEPVLKLSDMYMGAAFNSLSIFVNVCIFS